MIFINDLNTPRGQKHTTSVLKVRESDSRTSYWLWYGSGTCSTFSRKGNKKKRATKNPPNLAKKNMNVHLCFVFFRWIKISECVRITKSEFADFCQKNETICSVSQVIGPHLPQFSENLPHWIIHEKKPWKKQKKNMDHCHGKYGFPGFSPPLS